MLGQSASALNRPGFKILAVRQVTARGFTVADARIQGPSFGALVPDAARASGCQLRALHG